MKSFAAQSDDRERQTSSLKNALRRRMVCEHEPGRSTDKCRTDFGSPVCAVANPRIWYLPVPYEDCGRGLLDKFA